MNDFSLQAHDLGHGIPAVGRRIDAVERGPRAGEVETVLGTAKDGRGVGEAAFRGGQSVTKCAKGGELGVVHRVVALLRTGEMRHDEGKPDTVESLGLRREGLDLVGGHAEPVHPGIHMEHCIRAAPAAREGGPAFDLAEAVEHGSQPVRRVLRFGARQRPDEHGDERLGEQGAKRDPLVERCHEESPATGPVEHRRDLGDTGAIGVGLDRGAAFRLAEALVEEAPVGGDRVEVDGEDRAVAVTWGHRRNRGGYRGSRTW